MTIKIPLSDIDLGDEETEAVTKVLKSKWLSMRPMTEEFENKFAHIPIIIELFVLHF